MKRKGLQKAWLPGELTPFTSWAVSRSLRTGEGASLPVFGNRRTKLMPCVGGEGTSPCRSW